MIKDMASEIFKEPQDTSILKKYIDDIKHLYRKWPNNPPIYLYNTMYRYAKLKNDLHGSSIKTLPPNITGKPII